MKIIVSLNTMFFKVILVLVLFNQTFCAINETDVKTSFGVIRGKTVEFLDKKIEQYLGIPYAEPPIGKLRFTKPKPIQKLIEGIYEATVPRNSCLQMKIPSIKGFGDNLVFNEDCLTLNIWTPKARNMSALKPVMVWLHGGGLVVGSIYQLPGFNGTFLAANDVVLVAPNYRLGNFGFLYGGTVDSPGNLGFYDQLLALKWIRENIHLFGGDKNQITIFGESAGSWSTSVHVLSPLSKGLFNRAIMESGAQFHGKTRSVLTKSLALNQAKEMAKHFNCLDDSQWLDCLRGVDAKKLVNYTNIQSVPLEETEFLPLSAQQAFKQLSFNKEIDIIAGVTRDEGSLLAYLAFEQIKGNLTIKQFTDLVNQTSLYHDLTIEQVLGHYLKNVDTSDPIAMRKAFYDYYGDILMVCPTYLFAKEFSKNAPTKRAYFYEITYMGPSNKVLGCVEETMGICHGADVEFVFGVPFQVANSSQIDINYSLEVMKMWTNFVKTGDPGSNWPQLIDQGTSVVKELNPHISNGVFVDPFRVVCDELWKNSV